MYILSRASQLEATEVVIDKAAFSANTAAQGRDVGVAEALGMARRPGRVDPVHVADLGAPAKRWMKTM
ncbi:MAG: hypothetical protein HC900_13390 [Methylacidiphilales bacterium]|nr:hypothetical protein [Candidatus Methylacidiphilales bacterium]